MKHGTLYIIIGIISVVAGVLFVRSVLSYRPGDSSLLNIHGSPSITVSPSSSVTPTAAPSHRPTPTPASTGTHTISVPFSVQAPTGVWDAVHEEMCEEVTIIMAHAWVSGTALTPTVAENEIDKLVQWENSHFGTYTDTSARQTAQMGEAIYGLHTTLVTDPSVKKIQEEIDAGNIVIMGMAGRMLGNPNYTPPGPIYHMLLIRGYDATGFYTNDDGTRQGKNYHYGYGTIMDAARDWVGGLSLPPVAIVVSKN